HSIARPRASGGPVVSLSLWVPAYAGTSGESVICAPGSDARDQQVLAVGVLVAAGALAEGHADALEGGGRACDLLRVIALPAAAEADEPQRQLRLAGCDAHAVEIGRHAFIFGPPHRAHP